MGPGSMDQWLGSEHPGGRLQLGRLPSECSLLAAASLGGPGQCSVSEKAQGEAGMRVSFSPLTAAPAEELEPSATSQWRLTWAVSLPAA